MFRALRVSLTSNDLCDVFSLCVRVVCETDSNDASNDADAASDADVDVVVKVFRALRVSLTSNDLCDVLSRLVETVAEQGEDMQVCHLSLSY